MLIAVAFLHLALALYTAWMAYVFWRLKPNAVRLLRPYFTALLIFSIALVVLSSGPKVSGREEFLKALPRAAFATVIYIAIWTTYFRKSKRVANTFGEHIAEA